MHVGQVRLQTTAIFKLPLLDADGRGHMSSLTLISSIQLHYIAAASPTSEFHLKVNAELNFILMDCRVALTFLFTLPCKV